MKKKNLLNVGLFAFCFLVMSRLALAQQGIARIYNINHAVGDPLFIQESKFTTQTNGDIQWDSKVKDDKGQLVMTEFAVVKNERIAHQYIEQLQINKAYELNVEGTAATFKIFDIKDGKIGDPYETNTVTIDDTFTTGPSAAFFLHRQWAELTAGKEIKVEFGVFEYAKTVSFTFQKSSETDDTITFRMKPTNFFISLLVDPLFLTFDKKERKILHLKGRTPLRRKDDDKWKSIDAEILYP